MKKARVMIYFQNSQESFAITYKLKMLLRRAVLATLSYEGFENDAEISLTFTDDEGIRAINRDFRGLDKPTDVLSFPLTDYEQTELPIDEPVANLGDVVLSLERARAQAEEFGHSFERETAFLTVHSMLHLLGYDHETSEEDELDMRRRQRDILESMGLEINQGKGSKE